MQPACVPVNPPSAATTRGASASDVARGVALVDGVVTAAAVVVGATVVDGVVVVVAAASELVGAATVVLALLPLHAVITTAVSTTARRGVRRMGTDPSEGTRRQPTAAVRVRGRWRRTLPTP
jgi:hypothetical protein